MIRIPLLRKAFLPYFVQHPSVSQLSINTIYFSFNCLLHFLTIAIFKTRLHGFAALPIPLHLIYEYVIDKRILL